MDIIDLRTTSFNCEAGLPVDAVWRLRLVALSKACVDASSGGKPCRAMANRGLGSSHLRRDMGWRKSAGAHVHIKDIKFKGIAPNLA
jgi:hypothetical protein